MNFRVVLITSSCLLAVVGYLYFFQFPTGTLVCDGMEKKHVVSKQLRYVENSEKRVTKVYELRTGSIASYTKCTINSATLHCTDCSGSIEDCYVKAPLQRDLTFNRVTGTVTDFQRISSALMTSQESFEGRCELRRFSAF